MRFAHTLALTLACFGASILVADDKPPKYKDSEQIVLETRLSKDAKPDPCFGASKVNFRTELKVPFDYLDGLGQRIHQARKIPDPVELAACARSLEVAEAVAGKKASVSAAQVMQDAVKLAQLRGQPEELKAVAMLVSDTKQAKELGESAKAAADLATKETSESDRSIIGTLQVINHADECVKIFVDGRYVGTVHAGETRNLHVHAHGHHNHLDAYCEDDNELVEHGDFSGHGHFVVWHIHP